MAELHDVSTTGGHLKQIWFRWKYPLLFTFVGVAAVFALSYAVKTYVLQSSSDIPESTFVLLGSTLKYNGDEGKFDGRHLDPFPDLPPPTDYPTPIDTIEIKWVRLNGPNFTAQLSKYASTLKTLHLNNITIEDHLQPVSLPLLKEFFLAQGLQVEERKLPDYMLAKGPTPWLSSTLFFLNDSKSDFDTMAVTAYKRGINVTIFLKGSITYQLNPKFDEVRLDISNCSGILSKLPQTYKILTLGRCRDLTPTLINPDITFLNFYIVYVKTELLSGIIKNLRKLEEFYAEIPDDEGPVEVRLDDFPKTLKLISISSMTIRASKGPLPNIKEFYFGAENQYGWLESRVTVLNESVYGKFGKLFPNVEKVGLFDLKDEVRYDFLQSVLKTPSVKWIIVENFGRGKNSTSLAINDEAVAFVEGQLTSLGLAGDYVVDFLIEGDNSTEGMRKGRTITKVEKLWYRFTYLGWCPIDSWPKYLYVQNIIEEGGILL